VRHCEQVEAAEHPLERIIAITPAAEGELVTTTGVHLARRIAHALQHAYKGDKVLRVSWSR